MLKDYWKWIIDLILIGFPILVLVLGIIFEEVANALVAFGTISMASAIVYIEIIKPWLKKPQIKIEFDKDKYCRHEKKEKNPCYYCHFMVINSGRSQADDCEVVLERVWFWCKDKKKEDLRWEEQKDWIPCNLKWSGEKKCFRKECFKTIYPGERPYFCDIVRVNPKNNSKKKEKPTCEFELGWTPISQDISLKPDKKYKIQVSIYSRNTIEATEKFEIPWDGKYAEDTGTMQKSLKIKML